MEIIAATSNKHKLDEIQKILKGIRVMGKEICVRENGKTFEENAIKKAKAGVKLFNKLTIADDSGLMVDCLGGTPGVKSARYASPPTPENLCTKLLKAIGNCKSRKAKFVCAIAIAPPKGKIKVVKGVVHGKIANKMRGTYGFGYDPVFIPKGYAKTFAAMHPKLKNKLSHRSIALKKAKAILGLFF